MLVNRRVLFGTVALFVVILITALVFLGGGGLHIESEMAGVLQPEEHPPEPLPPPHDLEPYRELQDGKHPGPPNGSGDSFGNSLSRSGTKELNKMYFPDKELRLRLESTDVWRDPESLPNNIPRVVQPEPGKLVRPLAADYLHPLVNDIFLLFKTGADIMWKRLPTHFQTTFTRFPNFALYSDRPGSAAGFEVIDILKDMPPNVLNHESLQKYRIMRQMQEDAWMWDAKDISMSEGWEMDRYKNIPILLHGYLTAPPSTKWFLMIDDDTYVMSSNIAQYLDTLDSSKPYYLGSVAQVSIPFAHGGSGIIVSRGALDAVFGPKAKKTHKQLMDEYAEEATRNLLGDHMVALLLSKEASIWVNTEDGTNRKWPAYDVFEDNQDMFQDQEIYNTWVSRDLWCYPVGTFHHERPHDLETLWEWEQNRANSSEYLYFYHFYRDFIQPYAAEEIENWVMEGGYNLDAEELEKNEEIYEDKVIFPHENLADCKQACSSRSHCYAWSFKPGECHVHEWNFIRGVAAHPGHAKFNEKWTSGFNVERIREMRAEQPCDPLEKLSSGKFSDSDETSEGWFWRKLKKSEQD